jgi:hypothetical protein
MWKHFQKLFGLIDFDQRIFDVWATRLSPRTFIPSAQAGAATARPMLPYPTMPSVWPETIVTSNCSDTPDIWLRIMRRRSLAKYRIAAKANSPSEGLKTPLPFVTITLLATSSGPDGERTPSHPEHEVEKVSGDSFGIGQTGIDR